MRIPYRDLKELGKAIGGITQLLIQLVHRRDEAVNQVNRYKVAHNLPIRREDTEKERVREAQEYAIDIGVDPEFAGEMMRLIIKKACEDQEQMRSERVAEPEVVSDNSWLNNLRENLLKLAAAAASMYEESYGGIATKAYTEFERRVLDRYLVRDLPIRVSPKAGLALDLGCATGPQTRHLAYYFERVIGLDVSPAMIEEARKRSVSPKTGFLECDLELGLPLEDGSVAFALMNMGTGSDIVALPNLLREIKRVLVPGGAAFISFYNEDALFYALGVPYYPGLSAQFNEMRHTLDVWFRGETYRIFARPYTIAEIRGRIKNAGLEIRKDRVWSHPTLASLIPDIPYDEKGLRRMEEADEVLASGCMTGAYIIIVAEKSQ